jgi:hypothetical protein
MKGPIDTALTRRAARRSNLPKLNLYQCFARVARPIGENSIFTKVVRLAQPIGENSVFTNVVRVAPAIGEIQSLPMF